MKNLILIILIGLSINSFAQFNSYSENKEFISGVFDITFLEQETKVSDKFLLSATEDYGVTINAGPFKSIAKVLDKAFEAADCEACEQVSEKLTKNPVKYIFDVIEYQDVFLVTEFENQYKVIRYQPKTED